MGLFSFIKDAGKKLFGLSEAKAATAPEDLKKEVEGHGFDTMHIALMFSGRQGQALGATSSRRGGGEVSALDRQHGWRRRGRYHRARGREGRARGDHVYGQEG